MTAEPLRARVFISCGQSKVSDEVQIAREIGNSLKVGFKGWERAGNVPELAEFIHEPPPLPHEPPPLPQTKHRTSQGIWRSAAAISVCVAVAWAHSGPYAAFAALLIAVPLDWATRRRQQFVQRLRQDIEHRMMAAR